MFETRYVLAVKPIKDFNNNPIPEDNRDWKFASIEYFLGEPMGYRFKDYSENTVTFNGVEQGELWWLINKRSLIPYINGYYDPSSLCIQKRIIKVETEIVKSISLE